MSQGLITESILTDIANAIRGKASTSSTFTPAQMASAITNLPSGGADAWEVIGSTVCRTLDFAVAPAINTLSISFIGSGGFAWYSASDVIFHFSTVTAISSYAFHGADFYELSFPACTTIAAHAFNNYKNSNICFPAMTTIPNYAFYSASCGALVDTMFPSATVIESSACRYANFSMVSMSKIISAYQYAFGNCAQLTSVSLPALKGTTGIGCFYSCTGLTTLILPKVATVTNVTFGYCTNLSALYLPECTKVSSTYAFRNCYNLLSLYLLASTVATLTSTNAFTSTPISTYTTSTGGVRGSIFVRESLLSSYKTATRWSTYADRFVGLTDAQISALGF